MVGSIYCFHSVGIIKVHYFYYADCINTVQKNPNQQLLKAIITTIAVRRVRTRSCGTFRRWDNVEGSLSGDSAAGAADLR
ncbi:hypothetical protein T06_10268 [Trichinella sp. T6]|nr:hypothetical protein T06_10268 [Trichinella sp. T6]